MSRNRNVYILGAGFSADAGAPVMKSFLQSARRYHDSPMNNVDKKIRQHYQSVFDFRSVVKQSRDSLRIDLDNIEELFGLVDISFIAGTGPKPAPSESIKHVIAHTVGRYSPPASESRSVEVWIKADNVKHLPHPELLRRFANNNPKAMVLTMSEYEFLAALFSGLFEPKEESVADAVITFNYDTILEQALWAIGVQAGYPTKRTKRIGAQVSAASSVTLPLAKMHGSSNWAYVGRRNTWAHFYDSYLDFFSDHEPIVVPPTWRKGELSPLLEEVWQRAYDHLAEATHICVIGYSMPLTDQFFHHLMAASLSKNPGLYGFHVVNLTGGSDDDVDGRYQSRFEPLVGYRKYYYHGNGVWEFLNNFNLSAIGRGVLIDHFIKRN